VAKPVLLVKSGGESGFQEWRALLGDLLPHLDVRWWDDPAVPPEAVHYATVWDPEPGRLARLPALRAVFGVAAGVDLIAGDPDWPRQVPLVRLVAPETTQRMSEYLCWAALSLVKDARRMALAQSRAVWDYFEAPGKAPDYTLGILGLGGLGQGCAGMLQAVGFKVIGWSRTRKAVPGVESFTAAELPAFLARSQILVCLLPATPETTGMLNAALFAQLPEAALLVQAGRGCQTVLPDVLAALDSGQLGGAVLDVFDPEPLPDGHPAWSHPKLTLTPHVGSLPTRAERAAQLARNILAFERGETLPTLYDPAKGY
jgi:glyoxylate/hydroxypyruvate reductase A